MNKGLIKNVLIVLLLTIAVFSIVKYAVSLKERHDLELALNQARVQMATQITALEEEKQNLLQEIQKEKNSQQEIKLQNSKIKVHLRASENRLHKLFRDYRSKDTAIEQLRIRFSSMEAENQALLSQKDLLSRENENLKAKLDSMGAAIEQPKQIQAQIQENSGKNRGFLLKGYQSGTPQKITIEVNPASQKE